MRRLKYKDRYTTETLIVLVLFLKLSLKLLLLPSGFEKFLPADFRRFLIVGVFFDLSDKTFTLYFLLQKFECVINVIALNPNCCVSSQSNHILFI